jgi:chorismate dehydratase
MSLNRPITLGRIDYANAWPIFHEFERHAAGSGSGQIEVVKAVPARLNQLLQGGELDVSAISSFSYGLNASRYELLPELSVGSVGKVNSILLFSKQPLETELPRKIAVTTTSATSVNLLKVLMSLYYECSPEYEQAEPVLASMLAHADAALIIGDPAIHADWSNEGYYVTDLGEVWNRWTGLGMTYAVVAVPKEVAAAAPEQIQAVHAALLACKQYNQAHPAPLADYACAQLGGERAYWDMYFRSLQYDFGDKLKDGLLLYFRYCRQLGLLEHDVELSFFEEQSAQ